MVVFICDGCQESLNRGKVRVHIDRCRSFHSLSCVDCGATFDSTTYERHISCFSESEKYTGKSDKKQDDWISTVHEALESLSDPHSRQAFEAIIAKIGEATIPRKKAKFVNLCKSGHSYLRPPHVEQIWNAIEKILTAKAQEREKQRLDDIARKKAEKEAKDAAAASNTKDGKIKLKKILKKADGKSMTFDAVVEHFGEKKAVKRILEEYSDKFIVEKTEQGKVVKLLKKSKEDPDE